MTYRMVRLALKWFCHIKHTNKDGEYVVSDALNHVTITVLIIVESEQGIFRAEEIYCVLAVELINFV